MSQENPACVDRHSESGGPNDSFTLIFFAPAEDNLIC